MADSEDDHSSKKVADRPSSHVLRQVFHSSTSLVYQPVPNRPLAALALQLGSIQWATTRSTIAGRKFYPNSNVAIQRPQGFSENFTARLSLTMISVQFLTATEILAKKSRRKGSNVRFCFKPVTRDKRTPICPQRDPITFINVSIIG